MDAVKIREEMPSGFFQVLNITHERLSILSFLALFWSFHAVWLYTLLPLWCVSPVSSLFSPPLSVLGQSLISEFPSHHLVSLCLLHFFNFNWCVLVLFFCFLPILMPELLYQAHSSLIDLHTHSLASLYVCSLSSWAEATLDNSDLPFPCVFFWHVQDRK